MKKMLIVLLSISIVACSGCVAGTVDAQKEGERLSELFIGNSIPIVELSTLKVEKNLVPLSANNAYKIDTRVGIEGEYYIFTIFTPHGTITAKGMAALVEYCYDAEVLEMVLSSNFGEVLQDMMLRDIDYSNTEVVDGKFFKIDSIAGIGRRFNLEYSEDVNKDIITDNVTDRDTIHGAYFDPLRMRLAYKLGLDPYSSNLYVQRFLDAIVSLDPDDLVALDKLDLVNPEINIHRGRKNIDASLQSKVLYPGSRSFILEAQLSRTDAVSLRSKLLQLYGAVFSNVNLADNPIERLVNSPHYSIREELYIFAYLNDMASVSGKEDVVVLLSKADSAFEAKQYFLQLQLLHAYYASRGGLKRLVALSNMLGAVDNTGQFVVIPTWDHTRDRVAVKRLLVEVKNIKELLGSVGANIWFVGDCDKNTKKTAEKIGINIQDGVVVDRMFRFTNYRKLTYLFEKGDPLIRNAARLTPNFILLHQRTNRPVPTQLLPDSENIAKNALKNESSITIEDPTPPKPKAHDPRNLREFGIGVKVIKKEELVEQDVPGIGSDGVGGKFDVNETGSTDGKLPPVGEDPVKVDRTPVF